MRYGIVVPNRFEDVIQRLLSSLAMLSPAPRVVVVADGHDRSYGYELVSYRQPHFVFARAANKGIRALGNLDVALINDDTWFTDASVLNRLEEFAYSGDRLGIVSPLILGCAGNRLQRYHERARWWRTAEPYKILDPHPDEFLCFPFIYLKRAMLDEIGLMNESFTGYGRDDVDLCNRARLAGWRMGILASAIVGHGDGSPDLDSGWGRSWSTSYRRRWPEGILPHS
jgi:GT2 family glycosyltransferase